MTLTVKHAACMILAGHIASEEQAVGSRCICGKALTFMVIDSWWVPLFEGRMTQLIVSFCWSRKLMASGMETFLKLGWKMVRLINCCLRWPFCRSACTDA